MTISTSEIFQDITDGKLIKAHVRDMAGLLQSTSNQKDFLNSILVLVRSKDASSSAPIFVFLNDLFATMESSGEIFQSRGIVRLILFAADSLSSGRFRSGEQGCTY